MKIKINNKQIFEGRATVAEESVDASKNFVQNMETGLQSIVTVPAINFFDIVDKQLDEKEKKEAEKRFILKTGFSLYSGNHADFNPEDASNASGKSQYGPIFTQDNFNKFKEDAIKTSKDIEKDIVARLVPLEENNNKIWGIRDIFARAGYYYIDPKTPRIIYYTFVNKNNKKQAIVPVELNIDLSSFIKSGQTQLIAPDGSSFTTSIIDTSRISVRFLLEIVNSFYSRLPAAVEQYKKTLGVVTPPAPAPAEKAPETGGGAAAPEDGEGAAEDGEKDTGDTEESQTKFYNIRNPSRDDFIVTFQNLLQRFAENHIIAKEKIDDIQKKEGNLGGLSDGRYGRRTHLVTRKAAESYLEAVKAAIEKLKSSKRQQESKQRRIENLAKLLNEKLTKTKRNWLFEAEGNLDLKSLEGLESDLEQILGELNSAHSVDNWRTRANRDANVDEETLKKLFGLMGKAKFDENGSIINLGEIASGEGGGEKQPEPKQPEKPEQPKVNPQEANSQLRDASCWYTFNITVRGQGATSPQMLWNAAGLDFDSWYANISKILKNTDMPEEFQYTTGLLSGYTALIDLLNSRRAQNINLDCFNTLFTPFRDHLKSQLQDAASRYDENQGADKTTLLNDLKGKFLNDKGRWEGTIAFKAHSELDAVLTKGLEKMRSNLIDAGTNMLQKGIAAGAAVKAMADGATQTQAVTVANDAAAKQKAAGNTPQANTPLTYDQAMATEAPQNPVNITFTGRDSKLYTLTIPAGRKGSEVISNAKLVADAPPAAPAAQNNKGAQQESLKQRREQLLHEALFKKLVR